MSKIFYNYLKFVDFFLCLAHDRLTCWLVKHFYHCGTGFNF